jgi:hypothetical protein
VEALVRHRSLGSHNLIGDKKMSFWHKKLYKKNVLELKFFVFCIFIDFF